MEKVKGMYGAKYAIPYNRTTGMPYGVFRVIQEIAFERSVEFNDLTGGDAQGAWDSEPGQPENTLTGTFKEYPNFGYTFLESATVTENTAETSGNFGTLENVTGTSVFSGTTGIAGVAALSGSEANIPFGRLVFKASGSDTVDIYLIGLPQGAGVFSDVEGKVASDVTVTSGGTVDVTALGIQITGGSGTIGFTLSDTAKIDVRGVNNGNSVIQIDGSGEPKEFGMMIMMPKKSDGALYYYDIFRIKAQGLPFTATSKEWSEWELSASVLVDTENNDRLYKRYAMYPES
jgi:hypothetical protein